MTKKDIQLKLPQIGDRVRITVGEEDYRQSVCGTVTYVNHKNLWYRVQYKIGNQVLYECFSPKPKCWSDYRDAATWGAGNHHTVAHNKEGHNIPRPIRIIATGEIIPSVNEAAPILGISPTTIRCILSGKRTKRPDIPDFAYVE